MNHNTFDHQWSFLSGTKELEQLSTYLNHMKTHNQVIIVSVAIDMVHKSVDYIVAFKANNPFKDTFLGDALD